MLLARKDESRHRMRIDGARRAKRDIYRGDLVRDGIELLQCLEERRNPIEKID